MKQCQSLLFLISFFVLMLTAMPALAFEILLDIDLDNDPTTINVSTTETSAVVKMILSPTTPGETIGFVQFGLGGECLNCPPDPSGVQWYGVSFDLPIQGTWVTAPGFDSEAAYMTLLGCPCNPGYHLLLSFEPEGGTMILDEPIFLATFNAWMSPLPPDPCRQPTPVLMAMTISAEDYYNYIVLAGFEWPNSIDESTWGRIKSFYR